MEPNSELLSRNKDVPPNWLQKVQEAVGSKLAALKPEVQKKVQIAAFGAGMSLLAACGGGTSAETKTEPTPIVIPAVNETPDIIIHAKTSTDSSPTARVIASQSLPENPTNGMSIDAHVEKDQQMRDYNKIVLSMPEGIINGEKPLIPQGNLLSVAFDLESQQPIENLQIPIGDWLGGEFSGIKMRVDPNNPDMVNQYVLELLESKGYKLNNPDIFKDLIITSQTYEPPGNQRNRIQLTFPTAALNGTFPNNRGGESPVFINVGAAFLENSFFYVPENGGITSLENVAIMGSATREDMENGRFYTVLTDTSVPLR